MNFKTGAMKATVVYSGSPQVQGLRLDELLVGGHFYLAPSQDGQGVSTLLPGKKWIENPGNLEGVTGATSENPADMLNVLAARGNSVVALGRSSVNGESVEEYSVTINPTAALAELNKEQMPPSVIQGAKAFLAGRTLTLKVWVDASANSLRQLAISVPLSAATSPGAVITVTEGFNNYGTPVSIEPPPASEVASYTQFEQAAQSAQSNNP